MLRIELHNYLGFLFSLAFDITCIILFLGARVSNTNVEPEVLILTDGRSDNAVASIKAAKELKSTAKVFGLIIGNFGKDGHKELVQYVSYPAQDHLFNLPNFVELRDLLKYVKASISTHKCAPFDLS